jgi:hypothetical protein
VGAFTGVPVAAPSRLEALRWVHSKAALVVGVGGGGYQCGTDGGRLAPRCVCVPPGGAEGAAGPGVCARGCGDGGRGCASSMRHEARRHGGDMRFFTPTTHPDPDPF